MKDDKQIGGGITSSSGSKMIASTAASTNTTRQCQDCGVEAVASAKQSGTVAGQQCSKCLEANKDSGYLSTPSAEPEHDKHRPITKVADVPPPPPPVPKKKKKKVSSILSRLRIIKASPSRWKGRNNDPVLPLPNEVVVFQGQETPSSCTERGEIEASLESAKRVLRRPSRFTFDVVPSVSESFDDPQEDPNKEGYVSDNNDVSGLSILDETERINNYARFGKQQVLGMANPTKLTQRCRTNSTSGTSELSSSDIFGTEVTTTQKDDSNNDLTATKNCCNSKTPSGFSGLATKVLTPSNGLGAGKGKNSTAMINETSSSWSLFNIFSLFDSSTAM